MELPGELLGKFQFAERKEQKHSPKHFFCISYGVTERKSSRKLPHVSSSYVRSTEFLTRTQGYTSAL